MTNYLPHYTKKKQILARKEEDLRRLICSQASGEKLYVAAEIVREARIRVLHAQRATIAPKNDAREAYDRIDAQIKEIETTPVEAILRQFGYNHFTSESE